MKTPLNYLSISSVLILLLSGACDNSSEFVIDEDTTLATEIYPDDELADMIDYYAGHPNDPLLSDDALGATDDVLEATNPRELADVMEQAIDFAQREVVSDPHYLFSLGRAAYFSGYDQKAALWLNEAAENGSAAAKAYLGYIAYFNDEDLELANQYLTEALEEGFNDPYALQVYEDCNFNPESLHFNRKDLITAFYTGNMAYLNSKKSDVSLYIGRIHKMLWSNDVLWIAEDPQIFMELDAPLSRSGGSWFQTGIDIISSQASENLQSEAHQDARRLALLYNSNPIAFRQIYAGMRQYILQKGNS